MLNDDSPDSDSVFSTSSSEIPPQIQSHLRILVVRPDRIGDVVLSTPVFEVIKRYYSKSHLTVMVQSNVVPILKDLNSVDHFIIFDPHKRHAGLKGFIRLYLEIKRRNFQVAVVLQSHWKIAAAVFLARIKYRIGPWSKLHSFFFYNRGVRQHRSNVEMHEADYNLQLLRKLGIRVGSRNIKTRVEIPLQTQEQARAWLLEKGWDPQRSLIMIHPGMGGSALNWPETHYLELIRNLVSENKQVLVTGGPTEGSLTDQLEHLLGPLKSKVIFYRASAQSSVDFLGGLCLFAQVVVAPSTGPLHLAVALEKPVVTFYPPIRVQSALRWGPYVDDETHTAILVPEMYCGQDFKCAGNLCNYYPCMKSLTVKQAADHVKRLLAFSQKTNLETPSSNPYEKEAEAEAEEKNSKEKN